MTARLIGCLSNRDFMHQNVAGLPCRRWHSGAHLTTDTAAAHEPDTSGQYNQRQVKVKGAHHCA